MIEGGFTLGSKTKEAQSQMILVVEGKMLDARSLHESPGPRYEKYKLVLTSNDFSAKSWRSQLKKVLLSI